MNDPAFLLSVRNAGFFVGFVFNHKVRKGIAQSSQSVLNYVFVNFVQSLCAPCG